MSGEAWIANLSQVKPPIRIEAVSGDLGSSRTDNEAALDGDTVVAILVMIGVVGGVSAI